MLQTFLIITFAIPAVFCRHVQFYRKDYTYSEKFDAFYKLHLFNGTQLHWNSAFFGCEDEGSLLFYPGTTEEWNIVNDLMKAKNLSNKNIPKIYVGIQNEGVDEFLTVDGRSTPLPLSSYKQHQSKHMCSAMDTKTGKLFIDNCLNNNQDDITAYICKKVEDISCPTIDKEYKYVKENKKCYKVNKINKTWHEALNTCELEGGLLVIIENKMEEMLLMKMLTIEFKYHAGFRMVPPSTDYYTLKGTNMRDSFWGKSPSKNRVCGVVINKGNDNIYPSTVDCDEKQPFVCEMEVGI